ncbi:Autoinducer 2 sensor kinase/phosphatase LuxQ [Halioglobus japonicus]|nr:Autoinducer 2 sensor kinase/phosphatase LuxQ [Halioglobus japonicus]
MLQTVNHGEMIVLRESIRARITVAPVSILSTALAIFLFIPFLVAHGATYGAISLWAVPILLLVAARSYFSRRIKQQLDTLSSAALKNTDLTLRISSIVNQSMVGLGIWIMRPTAEDPFILPLFMTLIVVIWSIGVMSNLFSDFLSFVLSITAMIGEVALFWLVQGGIGISIGISMLLAMSLMVLLVLQGSRIFRDSVLMRFEKDQLLEKLEVEQGNTRQALLDAQAANDSKAYFMAAASHDIKQPLYALGILTDTLLMSDPPQSIASILQNQRDNINQMSDHFDALMDMDKYQNGRFELNLTTFCLAEFARRIDIEFSEQCKSRGLDWQLAVEAITVTTDADLLLRLLRNLLANAVRYTDHGAVCCSASMVDDCVEFKISDTGKGIAPEHQKAVFEQNVRLENNDADDAGRGMGLSIVDKINTALALDLQMTSTVGKGTVFIFHLPVVPADAQALT